MLVTTEFFRNKPQMQNASKNEFDFVISKFFAAPLCKIFVLTMFKIELRRKKRIVQKLIVELST